MGRELKGREGKRFTGAREGRIGRKGVVREGREEKGWGGSQGGRRRGFKNEGEMRKGKV